MSSQQLVWLVTGCSTGFGFELIKQILQRGDRAIATARNIEAIEPLKKLGAATLQLDVTASLSELQQKIEDAAAVYGRIDVLVSNAGSGHYTTVEDADIENDIVKTMSINTFGAINMIRAIMPKWRKQQSGFLLVNSSYMSFWNTIPGSGSYTASKAALDRLVSIFAAETEPLGYIKTLILNPGHFRTAVFGKNKLNYDHPTEHYADLAAYGKELTDGMHGNQPGSVRKACKVFIDLVKGEGDVKGKPLPPSLPIGSDAWVECYKETEKYLQMLKDWEGVIRSTDIVPGESVWGAKEDEAA